MKSRMTILPHISVAAGRTVRAASIGASVTGPPGRGTSCRAVQPVLSTRRFPHTPARRPGSQIRRSSLSNRTLRMRNPFRSRASRHYPRLAKPRCDGLGRKLCLKWYRRPSGNDAGDAALAQRLEDAHVVGNGSAAHVEHAAELCPGKLQAFRCSAGKLHGGHYMHRDARRPDRMALGLEAARDVDRQLAVAFDPAFM